MVLKIKIPQTIWKRSFGSKHQFLKLMGSPLADPIWNLKPQGILKKKQKKKQFVRSVHEILLLSHQLTGLWGKQGQLGIGA